MNEITTMTVPPPLPTKTQTRDASQGARQTVSIRAISPPSSPPLTMGVGATVFVGVNSPAGDSTATCRRRIPEVQSTNGYAKRSSTESQQHRQQQQQQAAHIVKIKINPDGDKNGKVISTVRLTLDGNAGHEIENGVVCERSSRREGAVVVSATNLVNEKRCGSAGAGEGCVRISVVGEPNNNIEKNTSDNNNPAPRILAAKDKNNDMVHRVTSDTPNSSPHNNNRTSGSCFYYSNSYQSPHLGMVISSGQCSPSDTLDSGTCSDLDGTPPPLPKKKNASTVILSSSSSSSSTVQHNRTGSLTSSGAEVDSDDNESNISCDSLNGGNETIEFQVRSRNNDLAAKEPKDAKDVGTDVADAAAKLERIGLINGDSDHDSERNEDVSGSTVAESDSCSTRVSPSVSPSPSGTSSLSKASSTPRVRSPDLLIEQNGRSTASPVVKECTYEERKQEQERIEQETAAADFYANYNRSSGNKYVYDDDRFYKFHINELRGDSEEANREVGTGEKETDECFAGYKILDREAIRSAKGTVRGVKNRVRAGIATFLQKPTSKAYKAKEEGKVVVYTTTSGIVRKTFYNCMKVKQILRTHMVKYDERDLFSHTELQSELRDRMACTVIQVPQLFIDGQYIGDADTVERLNESGELRRMLKPYQSDDACTVCLFCGGYQLLLCPVCNGSKRSVHRNDFTVEFVALKCMKCDEVGLIRCPHC